MEELRQEEALVCKGLIQLYHSIYLLKFLWWKWVVFTAIWICEYTDLFFSMCFSNVATYDEIRNVVYWAVAFFTLASEKLFQIY